MSSQINIFRIVQLDEYYAVEIDGDVHVIPREDVVLHEPQKDCICSPIWNEELRAEKEGTVRLSVWLHRDISKKENLH
jgi:hypothetical protein